MRESTLEKKLVDRVHAVGGLCYKFTSPGCRGVPDRIVILPDGSVTFFEVKSAKGRLSATQKQQIKAIRSRGVQVIVLSSTELLDAWSPFYREPA